MNNSQKKHAKPDTATCQFCGEKNKATWSEASGRFSDFSFPFNCKKCREGQVAAFSTATGNTFIKTW